MVERFHADPRVQATELLLQERVPRGVAPIEPRPHDDMRVAGADRRRCRSRRFRTPHTFVPAHAVPVERPLRHLAHQRRRRRQHVARAAGDALAPRRHLRRGRPVRLPARRPQRRRSGRPTYQPTRQRARRLRRDVLGRPGHVPPPRRGHRDAARRRRVHRGRRRGAARSPCAITATRIREIDVTSYAEIVLTAAAARPRPPGLRQAVRRNRVPGRQRRPAVPPPAARPGRSRARGLFHALSLEGRPQGPLEWETDRARFLGRGRTTGQPAGARRPRRSRAPPASCSIRSSACGSASGCPRGHRPPGLRHRHGRRPRDRRGAGAQVSRVRAPPPAPSRWPPPTRRAPCATSASRPTTRCCSSGWRRACSAPTARSRAEPEVIAANELGPGRPVAARHLRRPADPARARRRRRRRDAGAAGAAGAGVLAPQGPERRRRDPQRASDQLSRRDAGAAHGAARRRPVERRGSTGPAAPTCCAADRMGQAERVLLETVARAVLRGDARRPARRSSTGRMPARADRTAPSPSAAARAARRRRWRRRSMPALTLANGLGGFTDDGRAYAIALEGVSETPMPWVNVIANPHFGTIVTASGAAHTWAGNSRENRLTPFANDPVTDPTGGSDLRPRRRHRRVLVAHPGPAAARRERPACVVQHTAGLTRFTRVRPRHRARARGVRRRRRPGEVLAAHA